MVNFWQFWLSPGGGRVMNFIPLIVKMLPAKNGENLPCGFLVVKKCKIVSG